MLKMFSTCNILFLCNILFPSNIFFIFLHNILQFYSGKLSHYDYRTHSNINSSDTY